MNAWIDGVLAWFAPGSAGRSRSENEMIRVFVFTHLFGPIIAQPMGLFLIFTSPSVDAPLVIMIAAICSFWTLPFLLRATGDIKLASFLSFELLTATALFGTFFYGRLQLALPALADRRPSCSASSITASASA